MKLEGFHHITAITADAPGNVDFYARTLGLRMVKKTVNFDAPDVYHLYYADEHGSPGSVLTFFEFPGVPRGVPGVGMVHRIQWRVAGPETLDFWSQRLASAGVEATGRPGSLVFADPEGLEHELLISDVPDRPLTADAAGIPDQHALQGFHGVRAYAVDASASATLLTDHLGFDASDGGFETVGEQRRGRIAYDTPPKLAPVQGAGSVHHVAWAAVDDDQLAQWRAIAAAGGARPTPIIDRQYFHSVYFREPSGVLFELATLAPGFAIDEPAETLGERLSLPPRYEARREQLERDLTPLVNPRATARE